MGFCNHSFKRIFGVATDGASVLHLLYEWPGAVSYTLRGFMSDGVKLYDDTGVEDVDATFQAVEMFHAKVAGRNQWRPISFPASYHQSSFSSANPSQFGS